MKKQQTWTLIGTAVGMLLLILDGKTALSGAQEGIDLCIRTLIPSLFPFFILSALLTGSLAGQPIGFLRPVGRLCGIPSGAESILAVGFLGGYPVGAQLIGQAWHSGQLSRADAERMLGFCNNAGPSFLFGIIAPMFSDSKYAWLLWGIHILSALLVGIITADKSGKSISQNISTITVTVALEHSVKVMGMVCGWVVMFRMILQFLDRWILWLLPDASQVLLSGILELSNGCVQLGSIENESLRFIIAGILLAFGGTCVTMQTASAASGLSLRQYLPVKLLQACFSFLLCVLVQIHQWRCPMPLLAVVSFLALILVFTMKRNKKISSIPAACVV